MKDVKEPTEVEALDTTGKLQMAMDGSFYTIIGAGGDLQDWINGYEDLLAQKGIGKPVKWYSTTGETVNELAGPRLQHRDAFKGELTFLLFPNDGLNVGALAMFKLSMSDRWFDDIVQNMRTSV